MVTGPTEHHSRKSIVLSTANKDGGAHVDDNISDEFASLKRGFWTFEKENSSKELADYHFIAIRQFGYELLHSPELSTLFT